eukprot:9899854-Ditylum_brightwellii.AAC.1
MGDDAFDGLCCDYGSGFYSAYLGTVEDGTFLFEGSRFGGGEAWTFSVAFDEDDDNLDGVDNMSGTPPTPNPTLNYQQSQRNGTELPSIGTTDPIIGGNSSRPPMKTIDTSDSPINMPTKFGLAMPILSLVAACSLWKEKKREGTLFPRIIAGGAERQKDACDGLRGAFPRQPLSFTCDYSLTYLVLRRKENPLGT